MDVFGLRQRLVNDYADFTRSFVNIRDERIFGRVDQELEAGLLWPHPIVQLNPAFKPGGTIDDLVDEGLLHERCRQIFRRGKSAASPEGEPLRLHRHQREAIEAARRGGNYVLTTGTGSGKSLSYIVPIVDHVLRNGTGRGIQALVVYPMNALANSQLGELEKFLSIGPPGSTGLASYRRYTGQERQEDRDAILQAPPDILLTNYVMLEYILTRPFDSAVVLAAQGLRFLVFDELHTYRGRQGADVALLARRVREACNADDLQHVGTSATLAGAGTPEEQRREVAGIATLVFGDDVIPESVIGETLRRATVPSRDDAEFVEALRARIDAEPPREYEAFLADPLASWVETTLGLSTDPGGTRLVRAMPRPIHGDEGAAALLASLTGRPPDDCAAAIERTLMQGYRIRHPDTGFPIFAFRVHQFFSRGETVYASLEPEDVRFSTTEEQRFVPVEGEAAVELVDPAGHAAPPTMTPSSMRTRGPCPASGGRRSAAAQRRPHERCHTPERRQQERGRGGAHPNVAPACAPHDLEARPVERRARDARPTVDLEPQLPRPDRPDVHRTPRRADPPKPDHKRRTGEPRFAVTERAQDAAQPFTLLPRSRLAG